MRFKKFTILLFIWIIVLSHENISYSYTSHLDIKHQKIHILSSSPKIWSKASNRNNYYSYMFRLENDNNFINIILNKNKFDYIEFYYNTYCKSDQNIPDSFINDIKVLIGKNENSLKKLVLTQITKIDQQKVKLDISKWKGIKKLTIKILIKNDKSIGTEIFGIFPFNQKKQPKRVILISLDTVGSKHMSLYGYEKLDTTPGLNEIVKKEDNIYVFKNAFGQSWWTAPSHATMFTGLYPFQHNMTHINKFQLQFSKNIQTLNQILQKNGIYIYHSISTSTIGYKFGYNRGVSLYADHSEFKDGEKARNTIKYAINVIRENLDKDIFLFLHFFDAHDPYTEFPENYNIISKDLKPIPNQELIRNYSQEFFEKKGYDPRIRLNNKEKYKISMKKIMPNMERAYDLGIRLLDYHIKTLLFDNLKKINIWDSFDILVVGDHGEEFFEHSGLTHTSLYNDNIKVPLIIKLNSTNNKRSSLNRDKFINTKIEAHIATFWTILDMFNLNNVKYLRSLKKSSHSLLNNPNINKEVFSELFPDYGSIGPLTEAYLFYQAFLVNDNFKLILTTYIKKRGSFKLNNEYYELYDIQKDPEEKFNLINSDKYKKLANKLKKNLINRI